MHKAISPVHRSSRKAPTLGDLKGLLETVRGCPSRPQQPARVQLQDFKETLLKLDAKRLGDVLAFIRIQAAEQAQ